LRKIKEISVCFDKVILQPGLYYNVGSYYESYEKAPDNAHWLADNEKWRDIFELIEQDNSGKFGVELEFDLGLLTGRSDRSPALSPADKQSAFIDYIDKIIPRLGEKPIGIYSGGPNEQGYNNIYRNSNLHNNQNHAPTIAGFSTGANYSDLYNGNLIYEINGILFSDRSNQEKQNELINLINHLRQSSKT
jgi:hypothetical protein